MTKEYKGVLLVSFFGGLLSFILCLLVPKFYAFEGLLEAPQLGTAPVFNVTIVNNDPSLSRRAEITEEVIAYLEFKYLNEQRDLFPRKAHLSKISPAEAVGLIKVISYGRNSQDAKQKLEEILTDLNSTYRDRLEEYKKRIEQQTQIAENEIRSIRELLSELQKSTYILKVPTSPLLAQEAMLKARLLSAENGLYLLESSLSSENLRPARYLELRSVSETPVFPQTFLFTFATVLVLLVLGLQIVYLTKET